MSYRKFPPDIDFAVLVIAVLVFILIVIAALRIR